MTQSSSFSLTRLRSSNNTSPSASTRTEPNGSSPRSNACRASSTQRASRDWYERMLRVHVWPTLGRYPMAKLAASPALVDAWYGRLIDADPTSSTPQAAYKALRMVCTQAVRQRIIATSPCTTPEATVRQTPERRPLEVDEFYVLLDAVPEPDPARRLQPPAPSAAVSHETACRYAPRCALARRLGDGAIPAPCQSDVPPLRQIAAGQFAACHFSERMHDETEAR